MQYSSTEDEEIAAGFEVIVGELVVEGKVFIVDGDVVRVEDTTYRLVEDEIDKKELD